ncbi:hypothetical protein [Chitinophaga sp. LS1]|uniref:hypothetical protein n=1 Tax=Chitinophaga sp. LS1 TaxID=3051176 RepID=UPI002AAAF076|nr:hypothetical protein [Chitinophaga sp. LS1]WPV64281.1 hypothetical protein QQL36_20990 [Chitinophaga sp. LS1]
MKKKYLAFAFVMATFAACKKDASNPAPQTLNSSTIATLAKNFDIADPTRESLVSIVNFLDTASAEDRKILYDQIYPATETNENSKIADETGPTAYDIAGSMQPLANPNDDPDAFYTTGPGPYGFSMLYNWTVLSSSISTYIIMATERCELSDGGPTVDLSIRYAFNALTHAGSHIVGISVGTSWTEIACDQYKGSYTAYSTVQGVLSGAIFDVQGIGTRIFNAGAVIVSNGRNSVFY